MEKEEDWHRNWRAFLGTPSDPRIEIEAIVEHGEDRHFCDACVDKQFSIICRRSRVQPVRREAMETFFGRMVWILDARRTDYGKLCAQRDRGALIPIPSHAHTYYVRQIEDSFFRNWTDFAKPLLFDFEAASTLGFDSNAKPEERNVWCVLPAWDGPGRFVIEFPRAGLKDRFLKHGDIFAKPLDEVLAFFAETVKNAGLLKPPAPPPPPIPWYMRRDQLLSPRTSCAQPLFGRS